MTRIAENTVRAGILAFNQLFETDHRAMHIDIDLLAILQGKIAKIHEPTFRYINGHDPALIIRYRFELFQYLEAHNICKRHEAIKKLGDAQHLTPRQERQLQKAMEGLDEDLTRGMLHAESVLAKTNRDIPYSSALIQARSKLVYWRLRQTEIRKKRPL